MNERLKKTQKIYIYEIFFILDDDNNFGGHVHVYSKHFRQCCPFYSKK